MGPPPTFTPLKPHRGQHAGLIALGLLVATLAVVWTTRKNDPPPLAAVDARPRPAASMAIERPALASIELGRTTGTALVGERDFQRMVGGTGEVTFDESRTHHVRMPVAGWLVKTRATSLGRVVRAGETVGVIYSPEVYLTTLDLLAQLRNFQSQELVDRERIRLLRWGMRQEQVTRIERSLKPSAELPIIARVTGRVVVEQGTRRQLLDPSFGDVFTITDPTYASVYVEIPMADAELVKLAMPARAAIGGVAQTAPVGYISRSVERGMKTVRVDLHPSRVKMPPTVDATVELARATTHGPAIPEAAVVNADGHSYAYVVRGEVAQPRVVTLGPTEGGFVMVAHGIEAGETVALPPR